MKVEEKNIKELFKVINYHVEGIRDSIKMGDDGFLDHCKNECENIEKLLEKWSQDNMMEPVPAIVLKDLKEGSNEERMYAWCCRMYNAIPEEEIFQSDDAVKCIVEAKVDTNAVMLEMYKQLFYTYLKVTERAFNKIIIQRRKNSKQKNLFE